MNIIDQYKKSRQDIFDHVGIETLPEHLPIFDYTKYYWRIDIIDYFFQFSNNIIDIDIADRYYIIQPPYSNNLIYRGKNYTLLQVIDDWYDIDMQCIYIILDNRLMV